MRLFIGGALLVLLRGKNQCITAFESETRVPPLA